MNKIAATTSPLQQAGVMNAEFHSANLLLQEVPNASVLRLRSLQPQSTAAALQASGLEVPLTAGGSVGADPTSLCLRPGEWLVCSTLLPAAELLQQVQAGLPEGESAAQAGVMDVSDGHAVLRLIGAAAPWLLAKLSSLDFLAGRDAGPHCARTRMGQVAVVVNYHPLAVSPADFVYDLMLDRSIARYLWELLVHSAGHAEDLYSGSQST